MGKAGQVYLYLAFFVAIIVAIGIGWLYFRDRAAFGGLNLTLPFFEQPEVFDTTDWKSFKIADKLTVLYPPDWLVLEGKYISQYPYTPGRMTNDVYNAIWGSVITTQIQASYVNEDWFNHLYNAKKDQAVINEYRSSDQTRFTKNDAGRTFKRERFVLFQDSINPSQMHAYIFFSNLEIYELVLENYDMAGLDYFKKILTTAEIN